MKPIYKSKTFWANAIAVGTLFVPGLREWQAVNPEAAVVALGAANILLRIVTHGKITIFAGGNDDDNGTGAAGWQSRLLVVTAAGLCMALPSCSPAQLEAARSVPFRGAVVTDYGTLGYSSKGGVSVVVDRRSRK